MSKEDCPGIATYPHIERYTEAHTTPENKTLYNLRRQTFLRTAYPGMLSGPVQGRYLSMVSQMIQPTVILEIGTFTGYATLCLAAGLQPQGTIITIDANPEVEILAREYWQKAGIEQQVQFIAGDAATIIPTLNQPIDLVFIDADKRSNAKYYELALEKLRTGGFILVDNVLWFGKVANDAQDKDTQIIRAFNKMVQDDPRVENMLLPLRDGLMMIRKR